MGEIRVRNLPDWLVEWYKDSAEQQGTTLEGYMRQMLHQSALSQQSAFAAELQQGLDHLAQKYPVMPDSTSLIREMRDERG
jgi:plasmid stability protein